MTSTRGMFAQFCPKFLPRNHMELSRYKAAIQGLAYSLFYIIWGAILRRLSKCFSVHNKGKSWHLTYDPSHMVESIGRSCRSNTISSIQYEVGDSWSDFS